MDPALGSNQGVVENQLKRTLAVAAGVSPRKLARTSGRREERDFTPRPDRFVSKAAVDLEYTSEHEMNVTSLTDRLDALEHAVLLGQTAYCLGEWAQNFVFQEAATGELFPLSLSQLQKRNDSLTTAQKSRFLQFKQWVAACGLSVQEALSVDKAVRQNRYSAAHGTPAAQQAATVEQMLRWIDKKFAGSQTGSSAFKKFVRVAARLSTTGRPLQLDRTSLPQVADLRPSVDQDWGEWVE